VNYKSGMCNFHTIKTLFSNTIKRMTMHLVLIFEDSTRAYDKLGASSSLDIGNDSNLNLSK
jgi:hypothetical protein